jgi:mannose-P-dolichol utilization defect 1
VFNFLLGSLSRIFTTLQEVNDPLILYGYVAGFALNLVLAIQVLYYWNAPTKAAKPTPAIRVEGEKGEPIALSSGADVPRSTTPRTRRRG